MFKKKPQIKNLSPLRSSERRKLADQIRKDYNLSEPQPAVDGEEPQQTLGSLRNALLPESTSSAKFTTTHGPNSTPISGTIYVGAHVGEEERVLWFQAGKDDLLYPTVYTLWHNPDLVPLLHTGQAVVSKLKGGADLFAPGLLRPARGFDSRATKGAVVAVAAHTSDTVPRWVGTCESDVNQLPERATGTAARGLHWEGDEIWNWSALGKGGQAGPDEISGWTGLAHPDDINDTVANLNIEDGEEDEEDAGGAPLDTRTADQANGSASQQTEQQVNSEEDHIPTTKEIDDAFIEAFLYAVHEAKKNNPTEPCGLIFPIQPSYLISNMVQPHLRYQSPHYNIKKTSWKNTKKFIKHLDKMVLVKSKDRNGGETVILDIDFNDQQVKGFQPYRLPKAKTSEDLVESSPATDSPTSDTSINQKLTVQILYRASAKLVPNLLPSKTEFYTSQQITAAVKRYIEDHPDLVNESKKRYVKLDPFLANNILGSNSSSDDSKALATGEIDRAVLNRRILEDDHLCIPHHILLRNDQTYDPSNPTVKPKTGPPPRITLTVERRGGNKVVTAIAGLEQFFINPQLVKPELQRKCAGSASIGQLVGGKPGTMELQVQGDQRSIIEKDILGKRGIKPEWIDVVDKTKKKGKK